MTPQKPPLLLPAPRQVHPLYFGIVLVPVVIFLMHEFISGNMMARDLGVPDTIIETDRPWLESAGRFRFLAATWFYACLTMLAVALLARTLLRPMARATRIAALITWGLVIFLAAQSTPGNMMSGKLATVFNRLGSDVFEAVFAQGRIPGCLGPGDRWFFWLCGDNPVHMVFSRVMDLINILAGLGIGALIVGMILCLDNRDDADVDEEAAVLAENLKQMRFQLYLSGLILTFGMLFATSWMYWPLHLVAAEDKAAYSAVLLSAGLYTGTYFSLLILGFYLPVALILDARVRRLAERAGGGGPSVDLFDLEKWKADHGLKEGAADYLRAGLALAAPILASFAGGISPLAL